MNSFKSGCGVCNLSTDNLQYNGGNPVFDNNYGISAQTANGGARKKNNKRKSPVAKRKSPVAKRKSVKKTKKRSFVNKVKNMFTLKGGNATGLPARWYNNSAVGNTAEHTSNALADKYGQYEARSMGPDSNLYPFSPFTSSDPFKMIQDNKVGGAKKKKAVKKSTKKAVKKSTKKAVKKSTKKTVKKSSPKKKVSKKK